MRVIKLLVAVFLWSGCTLDKEEIEVEVHKDLCVSSCVSHIIYNLEMIAGGETAEIEKICNRKFQQLNCCEISQKYQLYGSCKSQSWRK